MQNDINIDEIVNSVVESVKAGLNAGSIDLSPDTTTREISLNQKDDVSHVAIGSDHRGRQAKDVLKTYLGSIGYKITDIGTHSDEVVDFPDLAVAVAKKVASGECERGIMIDLDGLGSCMACNKIKGIRAALCYDIRSVVNSREHLNANVLTLGGPFHNSAELCEMAKLWLELRFPSGKQWSSINKIMSLERS